MENIVILIYLYSNAFKMINKITKKKKIIILHKTRILLKTRKKEENEKKFEFKLIYIHTEENCISEKIKNFLNIQKSIT